MTKKKKDYRFDRRTQKQFEKDIKEGHKIERMLLDRWLDCVEKTKGKRPMVEFTGCGEDGEYLERNQVNDNADFYVDGYGLVEIKFSKPLLTENFHLKISQVESYIRQDANILMVIGTETDTPKYVLITTDNLVFIKGSCKIVRFYGFGGKESYRIGVSQFAWREFSD